MLGALKAVPGVKKAEVSLEAGTANVLHDGKKVTPADLVKAVNAISHHGRPGAFKASVLPMKLTGVGQDKPKHSQGETPMIPVSILSEGAGPLTEAFNKESDKTRLVLLLSPT